ncbi:hypothetical protein BLOT_014181, partial [Blomia tropicalis]
VRRLPTPPSLRRRLPTTEESATASNHLLILTYKQMCKTSNIAIGYNNGCHLNQLTRISKKTDGCCTLWL